MAFTGLQTSSANFANTVVALVNRRLEEELRAPLIWMADALPSQFIPGTNEMRYVRYADIGSDPVVPAVPGTAPWLTEATPPASVSLTIGYDTFQASQAGVVIAISDIALVQSPHDLIAVATDRGLFDAKRTIDRFLSKTVGAGTSILYATGAADSAQSSANPLTGSLVAKAVATLRKTSVPTFDGAFYHGILHPDVEFDLESDTAQSGWLNASTYVDNRPLITGEIGSFHGVRFVVSAEAINLGGVGVTGAQVYGTCIYGPNAWAFGDMQTLRASFVQGASKSDPLNQQALIGWKAMFGSTILDAAGARYV